MPPSQAVEGARDDAGADDGRRERLGKNLFDIGDAVIVTDASGKIILLNRVAEALTGWADSEAQDRPIEQVFRIVHELTRQPVSQPARRVIEQGVVQNLAQFTLLIASDGVERPIDDSAAPIRDPAGELEGVVLIFKDISERREVERGLEESRLQGEVIIATLRDAVVVLDDGLRVCSANRSYYDMFRASPGETIGRSLFDVDGGRWDLAPLRASLGEMLALDRPLDCYQVERDLPGVGPRVVILGARRLYREKGREPVILLTIEDITDRRGIEASLAASELRFRRLFEAAKDGILILDGESGAITEANPFLLELIGYAEGELIGKHPWDIGLLGDERASRAAFRQLQASGYVRYDHLPLETRGGRRIEVEVVSNLYQAGGRPIIQCNIRDVTERKRADEELRRAKDAAEEAGRSKDLFLATLSHELRTPLTPVLATVEYLEKRHDLPEDLRGDIASIRRNIELEARLIDDLLDVTRIGQGKLVLRREVLDVHVAVRTALEFCQVEIEAKKLEVGLALRAEDHRAWADAARLQQVFWNLIKNAVKFTPVGGSIAIRSSDAGDGWLAIEVVDSGSGIAPEALTRIFGVFEQGGRDVTRRHGGLGLGLAIAKMLVDLHGGTLAAASRGPGTGSTFRVELEQVPRVIEPPDRSPPPPGPEVAPLKVLLVEDNVDTLRAISQLLRSAGFVVRTAGSVDQAMAALAAERFNLLVSDIGLPDGSGLEVMRHGRDAFGLKGIAFSGYGSREDIAESRAAGFEHHLAKPTGHRSLVDLIRRTAS